MDMEKVLETKRKELLEMTLEKLEKEMGEEKAVTDIGALVHLIDAAAVLTKWAPVSKMSSAKKTEVYECLEEYATRLYKTVLQCDCKYLSVLCKLITICESEIDYHSRHSRKRNV